MNVGDVVRRKRAGSGQGRIVGIFDSGSGEEILVWWSDTSIFPNPTRERPEWLDVVEPARGRGRRD